MKKIALVLITLIIVYSTSKAQCTNPYYPFQQGTLLVTENYNAKGKFEGKQEMNVIKWEETGKKKNR